jgi:zinc protease
MRFLAYLAAVTTCLSAAGAAQSRGTQSDSFALTARLPVDAKVKIGTLPNGLRYYIRRNERPEKRAELRLVVNTGSILEKDTERGYAHFVEHTAFNGTRNFAKNDLVKYLQSIGVRFGADLNAYTSFDETVYILPVPTDTPRIVDQAFTILEDWAHGQIFDSAEVVSERGVVREEWRGSKGADERMLNQFLPIALKGSRYAERLPIGTEQSIMAARPSTLRGFYRDWYRPDLMAVVAVGDFDTTLIENKIKQHFSRLRSPAGAPRRVSYPIPSNAAPLIAIASDREAVTTDVSLLYKQPHLPTTTVGDYRRDLAADLYVQMVNSRLSEIAQKPDAPFIGAGVSKGGFVGREIDPFSLSAAVKDGGVERGLEALLLEARRVDQFGFLQSELDRARDNMLRAYEVAYNERDKTESDNFAAEYIRAFLERESIPGIEYEFAAVKKLLPTITLADVNRLASSWITDHDRIVVVRAPIKEGVALPTDAGILAVLQRAATLPVVAYTENLAGDALLDSVRAAGRVVATRSVGAGTSEWRLSNGARVLVKPTDFKADEILFAAFSPGGTALASNADFMSAALSPQIVGLSGLGQYNLVDLRKKLSGKAARVSASISEMSEGFNGAATPKDLETLLQLTYLHFTGARLDSSAFQAYRANAAQFLANRGASPEAVFQDTIQVTLGQYHHRTRPITPATFAEVDAGRAVAFFRERFADASDFTFVFVGNVDTVALKPLVERYLASLPSLQRTDAPTPPRPGPPKGVVQRTVLKGIENKASTLMVFTGPCTYTPENRVLVRALVDVMQLRLIETLRERLGGTYSPNVGGGCNREPRQEYSIRVSYQSSPENVEPLSQAVFALIDTLQQVGPTTEDVARAREQVLRAREVDLKQNNYWLTGILTRHVASEDIAGLLTPYDDLVRKVTAADIKAAANHYFNVKNYARFVLLPENTAARP